jgi:cell division protein FtsW
VDTDAPQGSTVVDVGPARTTAAPGGRATRNGRPASTPKTSGHDPLGALRGLLARPLSSYYLLLASSGLLLVIGLVMVFSATSVEAYVTSGNPYASVTRQAVYALIGLVAFWFTQRLPMRTYRAVARPLMAVALLLVGVQDLAQGLVSIGALGAPRFGPIRVDDLWLYLGPVQMQPSELGKLALALWGAGVLAQAGNAEKSFRDIAGNLVPGALLMLLLVGYGDLGTMICMAILLIGLMYAAGVRLRVFGWLTAIGIAGVIPLVLVQSYRVQRLTGFLSSPAKCNVSNPNDPCYQALEGRYAIANGGWFGVGLGQGHLKWGRLPNAHNDFIFALIAEELGVVGCFVVLALLGVLAYTGFRIARRSADPFRRIAAAGITTWLVGQATINIGGVIGVLPITGLPLPFISDGGSALVVVLAAIGVLASFARAEPDAARALHARPPDRWVRLLWAPLPVLPGAEGQTDRRPGRAGSKPHATTARPNRDQSRGTPPRPRRPETLRSEPPRSAGSRSDSLRADSGGGRAGGRTREASKTRDAAGRPTPPRDRGARR